MNVKRTLTAVLTAAALTGAVFAADRPTLSASVGPPGPPELAALAAAETVRSTADAALSVAVEGAYGGTAAVAGAQGGAQLFLGRYEPGMGRFLGLAETVSAGTTVRFTLDGTDTVLRAFLLDREGLPACPSVSVLTACTPGAVFDGGQYDAVVVTEAVGGGTVTLRNLTVSGDVTVLAAGGADAVRLEHCTIGGAVPSAPEPPETPGLTGTAVTLSVDREAAVDYAVVRYETGAARDLFLAPFWKLGGDSGTPSGGKGWGSTAYFEQYLDSGGGNITVLQALSMNLAAEEGRGGSVFDKYASSAFQDVLASYIRGVSADGTGTVAGAGHGIWCAPGTPLSVDCAAFPLVKGASYALAAVARADGGTLDGFRAIWPIVIPETAPPQVTGLQSTLRMDPDGETCSGVVSLNFGELLCAAGADGLRYLDHAPADCPGRTAGYFPASVAVQAADSAAALAEDPGRVNQAAQTLDIRFTRAGDGASLTVSPALTNESGETRSVPLTVRVSIRTVRQVVRLDADGEPVYELVSVPSPQITAAWDGR